jgi:hypothetical protein
MASGMQPGTGMAQQQPSLPPQMLALLRQRLMMGR